MPLDVVFGKRDALALDRVRNEGNGDAPFALRSISEHVAHADDIMPVHLVGIKAKSRPTLSHVSKRKDLVSWTVKLKAVGIDDDSEVGKLIMRGEGSGLPNRALIALAIAEQDIHMRG